VIKDERNKLFLEVDVLLENGDKVMVVEIKATPSSLLRFAHKTV
jgi:hypothetical protein